MNLEQQGYNNNKIVATTNQQHYMNKTEAQHQHQQHTAENPMHSRGKSIRHILFFFLLSICNTLKTQYACNRELKNIPHTQTNKQIVICC